MAALFALASGQINGMTLCYVGGFDKDFHVYGPERNSTSIAVYACWRVKNLVVKMSRATQTEIAKRKFYEHSVGVIPLKSFTPGKNFELPFRAIL